MSGPGLVIPVRFDAGHTTADLGKVGAAGKHAGDETAKGFHGATQSVNATTDSMASLMKAQIALSVIKASGQAIAAQYRETSQYIMQMSKDFQGLRKSMQESATLSGQPNTSKFTLAQVAQGEKFNLSPQEQKDVTAEFLNFAGAEVGNEPESKLTTEEATEYSSRVGELMKSGGFKPASGATLAGTILQQRKGKQNVESLMAEFSKAFNVSEKGQVRFERAAPEIAELMAMGVPSKEAAEMFSVAAPASPGQEGTIVQAGMRALKSMQIEGKEEMFGVNNKMTRYEGIKAFGENMSKRLKEFEAGGMTPEEADIALGKVLKENKVADEIREQRGLIAGFGRMGIELGGFKKFEKVAERTPEDFDVQRRKAYEESEQGMGDKIEVAGLASEARAGQRNEKILKRRQIAAIELREARQFEQVPAADRAAGAFSLLGADPEKEQQINRQAIARARAELGEKRGFTDNAVSLNTAATNELLRELNRRIEDLHTTTKEGAKPAPAAPLVIVPKEVNGRMAAP